MKANLLPLFILSCFASCTSNQSESSALSRATAADTTTIIQLLDSANLLFDNAKYNQSLTLARQCAEASLALHDSSLWSESLSCMLCDYQQLGMTDSALSVGRQLLEIDKTLNDPSLLSSDYNNLAFIYLANKDYQQAHQFIDLAIAAEQQVEGQPKLSIRYGTASEIHNMLGEYDAALSYIKQSYELDSLANRPILMGRRLSQMGDIHHAMNNIKRSEQCYLKAIEILESQGEKHSLSITYRQLGSMLLQDQKPTEAIPYFEKAIEIMEENGELNPLVKTYQRLSEAYQHVDEAKSTFYLRKYTQAKDSLVTLEKNRALTEFQVRYNTEQEIANAAEKEQLLRFTQKWGAAGIILLVLLAVVLIVLLCLRIKRNRLLRVRLDELQQQMSEQRDQFLAMMKQEVQSKTDVSEQDQELLEKINTTIFDLMGRSELTAENIASRLCITSQQLRRRLLAIKGVNSATYINSIRMGYAKQLLKEKRGLSITEVGQLCGFDDPGHFTRAFKKETGLTPSQFRG